MGRRSLIGCIVGILAVACLYLQLNHHAGPKVTSQVLESSSPADGSVSRGSSIKYAKGFTLQYYSGYKVLKVLSPWPDAKTTLTYVLVSHGTQPPKMGSDAMLVETPVRHIVVTSTTHVVYFAMLGIEDNIAGIVGGKLIGTPSITTRLHDGRIADVGDGSGVAITFNMEILFNLQPDLIMTFGTGNPQSDQHTKLQEAGFRVVLNAEHMETTPLGRTEWIKFIAAFFDKDAEAERLFTDIARRYETQAAKARTAVRHPTVFCGASYGGVWQMPGGGSFVSTFLRDSGAQYIWKDDRSAGTIPMNVESVIMNAKDADFWINPASSRSLAELAADDERYSVFRAFRDGRVYNDNAKINEGGGNDLWETGIAEPDQVLADLISIFHPELALDHRRTWYWQLPERTRQ